MVDNGTVAIDGAQQQDDAEKPSLGVGADDGRSISSLTSDEKTFGVAKVEAITSIWTKPALLTLYVLYLPPARSSADVLPASSSYTSSIPCSSKPQGNFIRMSRAHSVCIRSFPLLASFPILSLVS